MKTILMTASLLFLALGHATGVTSAASEGSSCAVKYGFAWNDNSCTFTCFESGHVEYSAAATDGRISVSASCGGGSGVCETTDDKPTCNGKFDNASTGEGTCTVDGVSWGVDEGTATCTGRPPLDEGIECGIAVKDICIPPAKELIADVAGMRCPAGGKEAADWTVPPPSC